MGFVVIRAASFHHVDALLASRLGGLKWNWILELGGILIVAVGALPPRPDPRAGPRPGASELGNHSDLHLSEPMSAACRRTRPSTSSR